MGGCAFVDYRFPDSISRNFQSLIKNGKHETYESIIHKFKYYDDINKNLNPDRGDYRNK